MTYYTARLVNCDFLHDNVRRLWLEVPSHFSYQSGQYIFLQLRNGEERPYSIACAPHENLLEFHIHYHATENAFTRVLFAELLEHKTIALRGPEGYCVYPTVAPDPWILLAGGTGLAPCKALVETAIQHQHDKPVHLYWGVRSPDHLYLNTLLHKWERDYPWFRYTPVLFTTETFAQDYRYGMVHEAALQDYPSLSNAMVFASGPAVMVYAAQEALLSHGLSESQFFSDYT